MPGDAEVSSFSALLWRGARGRCPRCGEGALFRGFLDVEDRCPACGLGLGGHDAGDGPAVLAIFILGFAVVGLALFVELAYGPPLWVHIALWTPFVLGGTIGLLRPLKGITVALQYRFRSTEDDPSRR